MRDRRQVCCDYCCSSKNRNDDYPTHCEGWGDNPTRGGRTLGGGRGFGKSPFFRR